MGGRLLSKALLRGSVSRRSYGHGAGARGLDLRGVFVPIPTPYAKNGEVDYGALAANFQRWEKIPFKGDVVFYVIDMVVEYSCARNLEYEQIVRRRFGFGGGGLGCVSDFEKGWPTVLWCVISYTHSNNDRKIISERLFFTLY